MAYKVRGSLASGGGVSWVWSKARAHSPSSRRRAGTQHQGVYARLRRAMRPCPIDTARRMGPCFRRDDSWGDTRTPGAAKICGRTRALRSLRLRASRDDGTVGGGAGAASCGPLGRKGGRDSGGPAIGDEEHFVIATLRGAVGGVARGAYNMHRTRGAGRSGLPTWTSIALGARRAGRSWIALFARLRFCAAHHGDRQCDDDQRAARSLQICPTKTSTMKMHGSPLGTA
jgi:hypothetical protein